MAPPPKSLPELALPEDVLRTRPVNATLLLTHHHATNSSPPCPLDATQAVRRSVSQRGGASLRRIFVKCGLSPGGYEAADYVRKCGLISARPTVVMRDSAVRKEPASGAKCLADMAEQDRERLVVAHRRGADTLGHLESEGTMVGCLSLTAIRPAASARARRLSARATARARRSRS
jgi:hypothetical protein